MNTDYYFYRLPILNTLFTDYRLPNIIFVGMEYTGKLENFNTRLWSYHVKVPKPIALHFLEMGDKRVVATLNDSITFQCAIMPAGDGVYFINLNKKIRDQLKLKEGSKIVVSLAKDESEYGLPFPEEFKELLEQDPKGNTLFHALTPGKQRNMIYAVSQVKHTDLKIHRGLVILEHLKKNKGKINFKELNQEIRGRE